mmetsp:Transcript_42189/g.106241  ORF Transcript_42189/g.106241 Transcript_42189/m.106241 type:complete len:413 (-) Transcript_42189:51-1289(-)
MPSVVSFALVVVQHPDDDKFCLVHEKANRGWWLPGGGVDAGQTLAEAALREVEEEAGMQCTLTGLLRIECCGPDAQRLRVIFHARPVDASKPLKSKADHHSRGARWVTLPELEAIKRRRAPEGVDPDTCHLRGEEPEQWFHYIARGGPIYPLSSLELVRHGRPREWAGSGDPPRAFYATTFSVALACAHDELVAVMPTGSLPTQLAAGHKPFLHIAYELAKRMGDCRLEGIAHVRHILDLRAADERDHTCHIEITYLASWAGQEPPSGCHWMGKEHLGCRVVVAHNNHELHAFLTGLSGKGWVCRFFEKDDIHGVVGALDDLKGAPLLCTSTFPLDQLPLASRAVIWSKSAASDLATRSRLLAHGAAFVASDADPTPENLATLELAIRGVAYPRIGDTLRFTMIGNEVDPAP